MKTKKLKKAGRPRIELDLQQVENLASLHCTMIEMAAFFNCSVDTLENNYSEIIKRGREKGKMSLRRIQYKHAETNVAMAIFLGKNWLGQSDNNYEVRHSGELGIRTLPFLMAELVQNKKNNKTENK